MKDFLENLIRLLDKIDENKVRLFMKIVVFFIFFEIVKQGGRELASIKFFGINAILLCYFMLFICFFAALFFNRRTKRL